MSDTSTKRVEEVALLHAAHAFYGVEPLATELRALREQTAALLRALAAERDALLSKLSKRDALHTQDLLAVQAWREANFSSTPWPPKERLVSWLMDEMTALRISLSAAEAKNAKLREAIEMAIDFLEDRDVIGAEQTLSKALGEKE